MVNKLLPITSILLSLSALTACTSLPEGKEHIKKNYTAEEFAGYSEDDKYFLMQHYEDIPTAKYFSESFDSAFFHMMHSKWLLHKDGDVEASASLISIAYHTNYKGWNNMGWYASRDIDWDDEEFPDKEKITLQMTLHTNWDDGMKLCDLYTTENGIYAYDEIMGRIGTLENYVYVKDENLGENYINNIAKYCGKAYKKTKNTEYLGKFLTHFDRVDKLLSQDGSRIPRGVQYGFFRNYDKSAPKLKELYIKHPESIEKLFTVVDREQEKKDREAARAEMERQRELNPEPEPLVKVVNETPKISIDEQLFNEAWSLMKEKSWLQTDQQTVMKLFQKSANLGNKKAQYNVNEFMNYFKLCSSGSMGLHCSPLTPPPSFVQ